MRQIKFRAWSENLKEMVSPVIINFETGLAQIKDKSTVPASNGNTYVSYKWISISKLQQFTGLLDKNGKEIFEGDRIKVTDKYDNVDQGPVWYVPERASYCIVWHEGKSTYSLADNKDKVEVIGNIYENPELTVSKKK